MAQSGPPHLALNPLYCFWCLLFSFLFVVLFPYYVKKKLFFWGACLFIFQCLPLFLPKFFFFFFAPFRTISLSLSLSLSLVISFFVPSLFSYLILFCFVVFVSLFLCLVSLPLFHDKNNISIIQLKNVLSSIISVSLVSCLALSFRSLFLVFVFPYLKLCFLFSINVV